MMLEHEMYRLCRLERQPDGWEAEVTVDPRHAVYEGHFPGHAVTPGACLLAIIRTCVSEALGRRVVFVAIKSCKFIAPVLPVEGEKLYLLFSVVEDTICCTITWQGNMVLKLAGTLASVAAE